MNGCRVCLSSTAERYQTVRERDYWRCGTCKAVFLEHSQIPDAVDEHQRYLLHNNDPSDPGYVRFVRRLAEPLLQRLEPCREGLDFGCGPGPALPRIAAEAGHTVRLYDPFFYPDQEALNVTYDFVVCSEVAEHFHWPAREFSRLNALLRPGGWLAVGTCFAVEDRDFADWHYRRDPTHVVFYQPETFRHLASRFGMDCEIPARNVALLQKRKS